MGLLKKLFGTSSEKELRAIKPIVDKIEAVATGKKGFYENVPTTPVIIKKAVVIE